MEAMTLCALIRTRCEPDFDRERLGISPHAVVCFIERVQRLGNLVTTLDIFVRDIYLESAVEHLPYAVSKRPY